MRVSRVLLLAFAALPFASGQNGALNPSISALVQDVSAERIAGTERKLESFQTRNVYSSTSDPEHGIGAAREWIAAQFRSYSPRLQVSFDKHRIAKQNTRMTGNVELWNVVAVLPGSDDAARQVLVTAHYDTISFVFRKGAGGKNEIDAEQTAAAPVAPGVTDDGSGVATVLELARVMSQHTFRKTIVFVAFAGEEYGLFGSGAYAQAARARNDQIDGVLNNDIIGSSLRGDGRMGNDAVNVYSEDPMDSPSRLLARYLKESAERYQPGFGVNLIFRYDRFRRGGDHTPFNGYGYPAVRITTRHENFSHQHTPSDTFTNTDPEYAALVAKANAAAAGCLATAPRAPTLGTLGRGVMPDGSSGYDAVLTWTDEDPAAATLHYVVVMRRTTAVDWEQQIPVEKGTTLTFPHVNIDEVVLGVKAIDSQGNESPVAVWTNPQPVEKPVRTY